MRKLYIFLFAAVCSSGLSLGAKADSLCDNTPHNLVTNCGFETGDFTGWTLTGNDVPTELNILYGVEQGVDPISSIAPNSGSFQAYVADIDANALTLSQDLNLTGPYDYYTVSFYLAQFTDPSIGGGSYSNELNVSFGATTFISDTAIANQGYTKYSFIALDTVPTATLSITLGNDLGEFQLDDVSVVSTPEPAAWFLLVTAGALCAFAAKRSHRKAEV
jgi:hypothetical protein